eukprot:g39812.t1
MDNPDLIEAKQPVRKEVNIKTKKFSKKHKKLIQKGKVLILDKKELPVEEKKPVEEEKQEEKLEEKREGSLERKLEEKLKEKEEPTKQKVEEKELPEKDSNLLLFFADFMELDKAKEQNSKLDEEILALRERVRSLDSERKSLLEVAGRRSPGQVGSQPGHSTWAWGTEEVGTSFKASFFGIKCPIQCLPLSVLPSTIFFFKNPTLLFPPRSPSLRPNLNHPEMAYTDLELYSR